MQINKSEAIPILALGELSEDPVAAILSMKGDIVRVTEGEEVAFYLASADKFRRLLDKLQNGVLNKSCCIQSNIVSAKTATYPEFIADPADVYEQGFGSPVIVMAGGIAKIGIIPPDIYSAMVS